MKKRPLCVSCILLIVLAGIIRLSGYSLGIPDNRNLTEDQFGACTVSGRIYQREYKDEKLILFLKQTVLSENSQKEVKIENVKITCEAAPESYLVGDYVQAKGELQPIEAPVNPGQFDAQIYYYAQKIGYTMWNPELQILQRPRFSLKRLLSDVREALVLSINNIGSECAGVIAAMVTGDKTGLDGQIKLLFQQGGISHILAISGLHLGILGMGFYKAVRKIGIPLKVSGALSILFMCGYGAMVGLSVSTIRALIMFIFRIGAEMAGRTYDRWTAIAFIGAALLGENPAYIGYSGYWLSFSAVLALMIFNVKNPLASGVCLQFFMAPVLLYFFYEIPVYGIFLNLFVLPTVGAVLVCGLLGAAVGMMNPVIGKVIVLPARFFLWIYEWLCEKVSFLPGAVWTIGKPELWQVGVYYAVLFLVLWRYRKRRLSKRRFAYLLFLLPACLILGYQDHSQLEITMLDVGQGDSIVIQTPEKHCYLIDGGSSSENAVGTYGILPFLKQEGINELEAVFLTHDDADHINGVVELMESIGEGKCRLKIRKIVVPQWADYEGFQEVIELADEISVPVYYMGTGDRILDGETEICCMHPSGGDYGEDGNAGSLVLLLCYGSFDALFTGDLEGAAEADVGEAAPDIDLLKVAHHGSKYSTGAAFLQQVRPEVSLISCSEENRYGHPHEELLERLEDCGSAVFITKDWGAVSVFTDGEKIDLKTYCKYNGTYQLQIFIDGIVYEKN